MGKMKEAVMEVTEYVLENMEDFYSTDAIPEKNDNLFDTVQDMVMEMVMEMDEETFFVTLMLATPSRKVDHAV
ncbi:MAG: hypothetical protein DRH57_07715 [Candidatus Cloacimonadota bacterium]|nr:MAG: hypothetical protein DRH57_07715 [Candidatus Cloacimonadota bacterium]